MMGRPKIPARLCAICVSAPASVPRLLDGERLIRVCAECGEDPDDEDSIGFITASDRRMQLLERIEETPGVTTEELLAGLSRRDRNVVVLMVRRMADAKEIQRRRIARRRGGRSGLTYALFPADSTAVVDALGPFQRKAVDMVRLNPGSSSSQLAELLGLDRSEQNNLTSALTKLTARGMIRRERMPPEARRNGVAYRFWIAEATAPTCACGAAIVRGGDRGPVPTTCRECAEQKRHGRAA